MSKNGMKAICTCQFLNRSGNS